MTMVLDSGAFIAVESGDRRVLALLRVAHQHAVPLATSAGVVAQVWRHGARQATLARLLSGVDVQALDDGAARGVGALLQRSATSDVVDAHVVLLAAQGATIITSDPADIAHLLAARGVAATVVVP